MRQLWSSVAVLNLTIYNYNVADLNLTRIGELCPFETHQSVAKHLTVVELVADVDGHIAVIGVNRGCDTFYVT